MPTCDRAVFIGQRPSASAQFNPWIGWSSLGAPARWHQGRSGEILWLHLHLQVPNGLFPGSSKALLATVASDFDGGRWVFSCG